MAAKKTTEPKKVFIVTWDNSDGDPVKTFDSLDKAKDFVKGLLTKESYLEDEYGNDIDTDDVDEGSIKVYEGVLIGKPKVNIEFSK